MPGGGDLSARITHGQQPGELGLAILVEAFLGHDQQLASSVDVTVCRGRHKLYRARKLLVMAQERLDENRQTKLVGLLAAGDPHGEVATAWHAIRGVA